MQRAAAAGLYLVAALAALAAVPTTSAKTIEYGFQAIYTPYDRSPDFYLLSVDYEVWKRGRFSLTGKSVRSVGYGGVRATPWFGVSLDYSYAPKPNPVACEPSQWLLEICGELDLEVGDLLYLYHSFPPDAGFAYKNLRFGKYLRGDTLSHADLYSEFQYSFTNIRGNLWRMDYHFDESNLPWCMPYLPDVNPCEGIIGRFVTSVPSPGLPEPGTLALLGLGLAGLGLSRTRKA